MSVFKFSWQNMETWPFDGPSQIFFARAFHEVGRAVHGEKWAFSDSLFATAPKHPQLPEKITSALPGDKFKASLALPKKRPQGWTDGSDIKFTQKEWAVARQAVAKQYDGYAAGAARNRAVKLLLRERLADETLAAFVRDDRGIFRSVGSHLWNLERFDRWFSLCAMNPNHHQSDDTRDWLFLGKGELVSFIATLAKPTQEKAIHAGGREAFSKAFHETVMAFPTKRTLSKKEILAWAHKDFQLSGRQADQVRLHVLASIGGKTEIEWRKPGR